MAVKFFDDIEEGGGQKLDPYQSLYNKERTLLQDYRNYQDALARNASESSLAELRAKAQKDALAYNQAKQQIAEQDFLRQRQLMQGAQARGLGASGVENLAKIQSRMATGQQLSGLVQAQAVGTEQARTRAEEIQNRLQAALSGSALQEQVGLLGAEEKLIGRQQAARAEGDADFQALYAGLANAQTEEDLKLLETYYKGRISDELLNQALANARANLGLTPDKVTEPQQIQAQTNLPGGLIRASNLTAEQRNSPEFLEALKQDRETDNDGQIVSLQIGDKNFYFGDDANATSFLRQFFEGRQNIEDIEITVEKGVPKFRVAVPGTSTKETFNSYNEAANKAEFYKTKAGEGAAQVKTGLSETLATPPPSYQMATNFVNWLQDIFSGQNQGESSGSQLSSLMNNLGGSLQTPSTFNQNVKNIRMARRKR